MKKNIILLFAILTLIPSIVNASLLDEYKLKWTDEGFDTYAYNPLLEADRLNLEKEIFRIRDMNQSKILEDSDGYIIIGNFSLKKYSRTKGLIKELSYDEMRAIEYDNHIIVASINYGKSILNLEKIDKDLNVVAKKSIKDIDLLNYFIEKDKLIIVLIDIFLTNWDN